MKRRFQVSYQFAPEVVSKLKSYSRAELYILEMYNYYLPKLKTGRVAKVILDFQTGLARQVEQVQLDNVLIVPVAFEWKDYLSKESEQRKRFLIELAHETLIAVADSRGWQKEPFIEAYSTILELNFRFSQCWMKPVSNPARTHKAQVCWEYTENIRVFLEITNGQRKRYLVSILPPAMGALDNVLGCLRWEDDQKLRLEHSNGRDSWQFDVTSESLEFFYPRAIKGDAHGQYDLGIMYLEGTQVLKDREKGIYWIKEAAKKKFSRAIKRLAELEQTH